MRAALLAVLVTLLASASHAFFGDDSRDAFRALARAKHTPALADSVCGKAVSITIEKGIGCPEVIISAQDLAEAGFKIGFHKGQPHLSFHGRLFNVITQEEAGQMLEEVQKEEQRKRQDEAVSRFMPLQGTFTIDDVFSAMPR